MDNVKIPEGVKRYYPMAIGNRTKIVGGNDGAYILASDLPAIIAANLPQASESVENAIDALVQECYYECDGHRNRDAETSSYIDALHDAIVADRQQAVEEIATKLAEVAHRCYAALNRAEAAEQREKELLEALVEDVSAIPCRYRGDPSYDHDAFWMKEQVLKRLNEASAALGEQHD